jgi:hypothetical protein
LRHCWQCKDGKEKCRRHHRFVRLHTYILSVPSSEPTGALGPSSHCVPLILIWLHTFCWFARLFVDEHRGSSAADAAPPRPYIFI